MLSIQDLVTAHREFLRIHFPRRSREFERILAENPLGAWAEAATFSLLQQVSWTDVVLGAPSPDFKGVALGKLCGVEVTTLGTDAVQAASEWPGSQGGAYRQIPVQIAQAIESKIAQVSGFEGPRLICVCSSHPGAGALLDAMAAERLLHGETKIALQVMPRTDAAPKEVLDELQGASFIAEDQLGQVTMRRDVSAVLLIEIGSNHMQVVGALHHDCLHPLDPNCLTGIPLGTISARLADGTVEITWAPSRNTVTFGYIPPRTEENPSSRRA